MTGLFVGNALEQSMLKVNKRASYLTANGKSDIVIKKLVKEGGCDVLE